MAIEPIRKLEQFFAKFRRLKYKKHEIIVRPQDSPSGVYFISRGYVKVYTLSESGQELDLIIFKPGDFFPMIWAFNNTRLTQYCEAMTTVEVMRSSQQEFREYIKQNPEILWEVTSKMLIRLRGVLERMEYMVFGNAYQKVASILVICAERFGREVTSKIVIQVPLTHKDIANLIGLTRETTSVELKKLENKGVYKKEGSKIIINGLKKLQNEANWSKYV